nr:hypothetical protein GCM10017547_28170 [Pseudarthrobacter oxydans]
MYSGIGAFMFFVPVTIAGKNTIMLDHIVSFLQAGIAPVLPYYALAVIIAGAAYPFIAGTWKRSAVEVAFSVLKVVGMVVGFMMVFKVGPAWLFEPGMGPFLFEKLVIPVGLLVPIGAVFLALLVSYGLLEFIGVMVQRVMRPIWRTPGGPRSTPSPPLWAATLWACSSPTGSTRKASTPPASLPSLPPGSPPCPPRSW